METFYNKGQCRQVLKTSDRGSLYISTKRTKRITFNAVIIENHFFSLDVSRKTQHQFHRNWKPTSYYTHTGTSSMENSTWASHYLAPTLAPPAINWPLKCDHPRARKKKNLKKNSRNITNLPNLHLQCVETTRHARWGAGLESPVQLALQE